MSIFDHPILAQIDARAPILRDVGLRVERDPNDWIPLWEDQLLRAICLMEVPAEYRTDNHESVFGRKAPSYSLQLAIAERMARIDASCVLAMPTPTLAGFAIQTLGTPEQAHGYFSRYLTMPRRSFFAVTEPTVGSDAGRVQSQLFLRGSDLLLRVRKKLIGSAAQSDVGLIFVRDQRDMAHKLILIDSRTMAGLDIRRLPMHGLAGADLAEITADDLPIDEMQILGHGIKRGLRDGFYAMNKVFARYRPVVSALAIGSARGLLDELQAAGVDAAHLESEFINHQVFLDRLEAIGDAAEIAAPKISVNSELKFEAIAFLDRIVSLVFSTLSPSQLFSSPNILKRCRDAKAFEYMEGTSHIQMMHAFRAFNGAGSQ